jgi:hypothetical protein
MSATYVSQCRGGVRLGGKCHLGTLNAEMCLRENKMSIKQVCQGVGNFSAVVGVRESVKTVVGGLHVCASQFKQLVKLVSQTRIVVGRHPLSLIFEGRGLGPD